MALTSRAIGGMASLPATTGSLSWLLVSKSAGATSLVEEQRCGRGRGHHSMELKLAIQPMDDFALPSKSEAAHQPLALATGAMLKKLPSSPPQMSRQHKAVKWSAAHRSSNILPSHLGWVMLCRHLTAQRFRPRLYSVHSMH